MKGHWGILQRPYCSERDSLDSSARIVVALTNLKIRSAPLFSEEHIYNPDPPEEEEDDETSATERQASPRLSQQGSRNTRAVTRKKDGGNRVGLSNDKSWIDLTGFAGETDLPGINSYIHLIVISF